MYDEPTLSREGLKYLDSIFFECRSKTITKGHSWYEAQRDPKMMEKLIEISTRLKNSPYQSFQLWYGSVNQFRPAIAKWIYTKYKPTSILDFSAGWGGRCLAALEMGIQYTGIDSNVQLRECYDRLLTEKGSALDTIYFQPAESFAYSTIDYDMIFTSPPYFMIERYECMPEYRTKKEFIDIFFRPVISEAWKYLKSNGYMCLNMPHDMYEAIMDMLPPCEELDMPICNRFAKTDKNKRREVIYIWHKRS